MNESGSDEGVCRASYWLRFFTSTHHIFLHQATNHTEQSNFLNVTEFQHFLDDCHHSRYASFVYWRIVASSRKKNLFSWKPASTAPFCLCAIHWICTSLSDRDMCWSGNETLDPADKMARQLKSAAKLKFSTCEYPSFSLFIWTLKSFLVVFEHTHTKHPHTHSYVCVIT